ncbi:MAG: hypothetical protein QOF72_1320, partial [Blastocatellia bacterium]|nr:hypothetical protein [Blastocatellia bacterium]
FARVVVVPAKALELCNLAPRVSARALGTVRPLGKGPKRRRTNFRSDRRANRKGVAQSIEQGRAGTEHSRQRAGIRGNSLPVVKATLGKGRRWL